MISKTKIDQRVENKRNPEIVETIILAKKNNLLELAKKLSYPNSHYVSVNIDRLNNIKENKVIVVGKVLGSGEINKKISIAAFGFSETAKEKLKKAGCEMKSIKKEILNNPKLEKVEIIG